MKSPFVFLVRCFRLPAILGLVLASASTSLAEVGEEPAFGPEQIYERCVTLPVNINQSDVMSADGTVKPDQNVGNDLADMLLSGRHYFVCPLTPGDGHGEGEYGPRSGQREDMWPEGQASIPFLRMNGLGAQRCWECHNSAGTFFKPIPLDDNSFNMKKDKFTGPWLASKPGGTGGASSFSNTLFQNPEWPLPNAEGKLVNIVRSPPSVFGTAYLQRLAFEMTSELLTIEKETLERAKNSPDLEASAELKTTKGNPPISFGTLHVRCDDASCENPEMWGYEGIQADLIVRPLQHKGVASTVRHFVMSALDFHMSVQPVELVGPNNDCDDDGLYNEMALGAGSPATLDQVLSGEELQNAIDQSIGNVTALTAWTGLVRPPQFQPVSPHSSDGREFLEKALCTSCHQESLTIESPIFTIQNPDFFGSIPDSCPDESSIPSVPSMRGLGSHTVLDPASHPVLVEHLAPKDTGDCPESGYLCIDLSSNNLQTPTFASLPGTTQFPSVFTTFLPRLPENGGTVSVPLYSDLKRHVMGTNLEQIGEPQADDSGNPIPNNEWLTSKLWGVGDTGPWLHDGRARTLHEAIIGHEGVGSEANDSVAAYRSLSDNEQQALVSFLRSLRLPADPPIDTRPIFITQDDEQFITMLNPITNITTQRLRLVDQVLASGRTKRLMRFNSTDSSIAKPAAMSPGDPTEHGATLTVYNAAGTGEYKSVTLPRENWTETASGYRYRGDGSSPVQQVTLQKRLIDIRANGDAWDYTLNEPTQGAIAVNLTLGQLEWCASALAKQPSAGTSPNPYDEPGSFKAQVNSPAPASCPISPSGF